mmetsp:Transcript_35433/g.84065  ORF Transcript_35433/g.84065 Transcript_35433/m.84065 type:complete len:383 (-) Transcript_35433:4-1152(-)
MSQQILRLDEAAALSSLLRLEAFHSVAAIPVLTEHEPDAHFVFARNRSGLRRRRRRRRADERLRLRRRLLGARRRGRALRRRRGSAERRGRGRELLGERRGARLLRVGDARGGDSGRAFGGRRVPDGVEGHELRLHLVRFAPDRDVNGLLVLGALDLERHVAPDRPDEQRAEVDRLQASDVAPVNGHNLVVAHQAILSEEVRGVHERSRPAIHHARHNNVAPHIARQHGADPCDLVPNRPSTHRQQRLSDQADLAGLIWLGVLLGHEGLDDDGHWGIMAMKRGFQLESDGGAWLAKEPSPNKVWVDVFGGLAVDGDHNVIHKNLPAERRCPTLHDLGDHALVPLVLSNHAPDAVHWSTASIRQGRFDIHRSAVNSGISVEEE